MPWAGARHARRRNAAGLLSAPCPAMDGCAAWALGVRRESIVVHLSEVRRRSRAPVRACPVSVRSTVPANGRRVWATKHSVRQRDRCPGARRTRRHPPLRRPAATAELPARRHCRNSKYCPLLHDRTPGHSSSISPNCPAPRRAHGAGDIAGPVLHTACTDYRPTGGSPDVLDWRCRRLWVLSATTGEKKSRGERGCRDFAYREHCRFDH